MDFTLFNSASSAAPQILLLSEAVEIEPSSVATRLQRLHWQSDALTNQLHCNPFVSTSGDTFGICTVAGQNGTLIKDKIRTF